jgi:hypothetical protein
MCGISAGQLVGWTAFDPALAWAAAIRPRRTRLWRPQKRWNSGRNARLDDDGFNDPLKVKLSPNAMVLRSPFWDYPISPALGINRFEANQSTRTLGGSDAYIWLDYSCARNVRRDAQNTSSDL